MFLGFKKKNKQHSLFAVSKKDSLPPRPRTQRNYHWKLWLGIVFFILFLSGMVYLIFFSPVFKIKEIEIKGNSLIPAAQIKSLVEERISQKFFNLIPKDTLVFLNESAIKGSITAAFPEIFSVAIKRIEKNELEISVLERKTAAVLCFYKPEPVSLVKPTILTGASSTAPAVIRELLPQSENCFFVDRGGVIYREAPEISGTLLPTFYSQSSELSQLKSQALASSTIEFAMQLKNDLKLAKIDLVGFVLDGQIASEIKVFTGEGWVIYFDAGRPAAVQAKVLKTLLTDKIKEGRANLQYVDLRVENRAYYK